jgi:acid phosphatase family membrane protein YuiD
MFAAATGAASPSKAAEIGAALLDLPPGCDEVAAQGIQAVVNAGIVTMAEFIDATVRQHGGSPAAVLNNMQINIQIQRESGRSGIGS